MVDLSSTSSHRMPTVSASQALQNLASSSQSRTISTGSIRLDALLRGGHARPTEAGRTEDEGGGLPRGQVTEVFGPSGVGKTTLALQAAANALHAGHHVVWVDCSYTLPGPRLKDILAGHGSPSDDLLDSLNHFTTPTLAHLMALLTIPTTSFPPHPETSLIIIESVSTLFALAYPRTIEPSPKDVRLTPNQSEQKKADATRQRAANRRWAVMSDLVSKLGRLAAVRDCVILLTTQTNTRVRAGSGAILLPALSSPAWDGAIANRIALFRDYPPEGGVVSEDGRSLTGIWLARVMKASGTVYNDGSRGNVVPFVVEKRGIREIEIPSSTTTTGLPPSISLPTPNIIPPPPLPRKKRKRTEVADSQSDDDDDESQDTDDEFGWADDDLALDDPVSEMPEVGMETARQGEERLEDVGGGEDVQEAV
ncbi:MAG: hypothetical protein M1817_006291 [Caeruleum heppii]|nr:MAG: hypothetical protein M1817_006291 [Caeruleum heppii]